MQFYETQKFQAGERTFYGFGNPGAWILVIGNEPVFDFKDARIESAAARKYQRFTDGLTWRKRKTRFEYYNKIFFVDVRQIIEQDIWLTDSELIQAFYASEFENLLKSDFVKQFPG